MLAAAFFLACTPAPRYTTKQWIPNDETGADSTKSSSQRDYLWRKYADPETAQNRASEVLPGQLENEGVEKGLASFIADEGHGRRTASGEIFSMRDMVAAHRTLPFDTVVSVTDPLTGRSVDVRIIDRGPFVKGRIIDVSLEAAKRLGFVAQGTLMVEVRVLSSGR